MSSNFPMSVHASRTRWIVVAGVAVVSVALGFTGAKILANETIGYLAGYTWFGLMVIGVPLVLCLLVIGTVLSFISRTRWFGALAITAAVLIVASAFTSFKILDAFGQVRYKHEQMISIGPEVQASLVIYFKHGVTQDQINYFWENVLSRPNAEGLGYWHREGIGMLSSVAEVEGHGGVAVNFLANATEAQRDEIKREVNSSPIVFKVLENIAPLDVKKL
jgi:hypothetical protein